MKITQREDFGLLFMSVLARRYNQGYTSVAIVAKETKLSMLFLRHIVAVLLKSKLIKSREGLQGGYRLTKSSEDISVAEIISAMSGKLVVPHCSFGDCRIKGKKCILPHFWGKIDKKILSYLSSVSLSSFAKKS